MERYHIIVTGVVQGVGFRYYTRQEATAHHLTGFVRNVIDSAVEIEVQGTEPGLERFIDWVKHGPPSAHVHSFHQTEIAIVENEADFQIR